MSEQPVLVGQTDAEPSMNNSESGSENAPEIKPETQVEAEVIPETKTAVEETAEVVQPQAQEESVQPTTAADEIEEAETSAKLDEQSKPDQLAGAGESKITEEANVVSCASPCSGCGKVAAILLWKCPKKSAVIFALGNVLWFLMRVKGYSTITLSSYAGMLLLLSNLVFVKIHPILAFFKFVRPDEDPRSLLIGNRSQLLNPESLSKAASDFAAAINALYMTLGRSIVLCKDLRLTIYAIGVLNLSALIGRAFTLPAALYTMFLIAFTVPRVYISNQALVDGILMQIEAQVTALKGQACIALKPAFDAAAPYIAKLPFPVPGFPSEEPLKKKEE